MWRYTLRGPGPDDDPEAWAQELAKQGWQLWIPGNTGATVTILGRAVRRHSLRRWEGTTSAPDSDWL